MGPPSFGGGNSNRRGRITSSARRLLQWGHRLSAVETWMSEQRASRTVASASMGPPSFGGGNLGDDRAARAGGRASMGPPSFGGGNCSTPSSTLAVSCFNGATVFRRWKLCRPPLCDPFPSGFNGATVFRRWKPDQYQYQSGDVVASMGPPSFGGGNTMVGQLPNGKIYASMGPPSFGGGNSGRAKSHQ